MLKILTVITILSVPTLVQAQERTTVYSPSGKVEFYMEKTSSGRIVVRKPNGTTVGSLEEKNVCLDKCAYAKPKHRMTLPAWMR